MKNMSSKTGPIITKKTKSSESGINKKPSSKGMSKPGGTPIVKKKGINPPVSRHGFLQNKESYK